MIRRALLLNKRSFAVLARKLFTKWRRWKPSATSGIKTVSDAANVESNWSKAICFRFQFHNFRQTIDASREPCAKRWRNSSEISGNVAVVVRTQWVAILSLFSDTWLPTRNCEYNFEEIRNYLLCENARRKLREIFPYSVQQRPTLSIAQNRENLDQCAEFWYNEHLAEIRSVAYFNLRISEYFERFRSDLVWNPIRISHALVRCSAYQLPICIFIIYTNRLSLFQRWHIRKPRGCPLLQAAFQIAVRSESGRRHRAEYVPPRNTFWSFIIQFIPRQTLPASPKW